MAQSSPAATARAGRLLARPGPGSASTARGRRRIDAGATSALVYVPDGLDTDRPAPLAVMLHGAGGNAEHGIGLLVGTRAERGLIAVAPQSVEETWDVIAGGYGPDVAAIDLVLREVFETHRIDPARVAVGGFSDGASYALSLGVTNGDLFSHILAFSPGFSAPAGRTGRPRIYVSHGTEDAVLPIGPCSRRIVPSLRRAGYDVTYHEFEGPHTVPADVVVEAAHWFVGDGEGDRRVGG